MKKKLLALIFALLAVPAFATNRTLWVEIVSENVSDASGILSDLRANGFKVQDGSPRGAPGLYLRLDVRNGSSMTNQGNINGGYGLNTSLLYSCPVAGNFYPILIASTTVVGWWLGSKPSYSNTERAEIMKVLQGNIAAAERLEKACMEGVRNTKIKPASRQ